MPLVVLDAAAFDALDSPAGQSLRAVIASSAGRGGEIRCAALTLAEVCRGPSRTRRVEAALRRDLGGTRIKVVPTDERLAPSVGDILPRTGRDRCHLADAPVVALRAKNARSLVITSDPDDIAHLASAVPGVKILTRRP